MKKVECSINGESRFSGLIAKVSVNNVMETIEVHYWMSQRFFDGTKVLVPRTIEDIPEYSKFPLAYFEIGDRKYSPKYIKSFYALLWIKYLDSKPDLVQYAKNFDSFVGANDDKEAPNAKIIESYVKKGRNFLLSQKSISKFIQEMNLSHKVSEIELDLLCSDSDVIAYQTNTKALTVGDFDKKVKNTFPAIANQYKNLCNLKNDLLGTCQMFTKYGTSISINSTVDNNEKLIANLVAQESLGIFLKEINYMELKKALINLKEIASTHNLKIGLPYKLGAERGGDWKKIKDIIIDVFIDYPATIYLEGGY